MKGSLFEWGKDEIGRERWYGNKEERTLKSEKAKHNTMSRVLWRKDYEKGDSQDVCMSNSGWRRLSLKLLFVSFKKKNKKLWIQERRREGKEDADSVCVCVFFSSLSVWCGVLRRKWRSISSVEWVRNNISVAKLKHRNHIFIGSISRNRKGSRVFIYFSFSRTIKTDIYKNFIKYFLSFSSDKLFYVISTNLPEWNSLTACITKLMRVISSLFA